MGEAGTAVKIAPPAASLYRRSSSIPLRPGDCTMRRVFLLALAALSLLAVAVPGHAQITTDQLNKLSLEALTAPPPRAIAPRRASVRGHRVVARHFGHHPARVRSAAHITHATPRHRQIARRS